MFQNSEVGRPAPQEVSRVESPRVLLERVAKSTQSIIQDPLSAEEQDQAVRTVLDGVTALHRQGLTENVRPFLQTHVFTPNPAHKIIADAFVSYIEQSNTGKDSKEVKSLVGLASTLGINNPDKFPDLAARLEAIKVKEKRLARSSKPKSKEASKTGQGKSEYDFIPYATAEPQPETISANEDAEGALYIGFRDIISYIPQTDTDMVRMMEQVSEGNRDALIQFIAIAVGRGYSDRVIGRLTGLFNRDGNRAGELIPILEAFSMADSKNPATFQLLGDVHLRLGDHREAIASYREKLKMPPKE